MSSQQHYQGAKKCRKCMQLVRPGKTSGFVCGDKRCSLYGKVQRGVL
jgi:hypothetical protein